MLRPPVPALTPTRPGPPRFEGANPPHERRQIARRLAEARRTPSPPTPQGRRQAHPAQAPTPHPTPLAPALIESLAVSAVVTLRVESKVPIRPTKPVSAFDTLLLKVLPCFFSFRSPPTPAAADDAAGIAASRGR